LPVTKFHLHRISTPDVLVRDGSTVSLIISAIPILSVLYRRF